MPNSETNTPQGADESFDSKHKDFQFALKELMAGYQPLLEEELKRAKSPESFEAEAQDEVRLRAIHLGEGSPQPVARGSAQVAG